MTTAKSIEILDAFQKGLMPNTDLDQAISVALMEMRTSIRRKEERDNRPNGSNGSNGKWQGNKGAGGGGH